MSRKKKIIAVIALCVLTFALDTVLTVYWPRRSYPTLQEAVEADGLLKDYPEMLARSDTENYTLVAAGSDGSKSERGMNFSVFRKTAKGWRAPSQAIYPISSGRIIDVGDDICFVDVFRVAGSDCYCISLHMNASGTAPTFADSLGSDFGTYSNQDLPQKYAAWAVLSSYPKGYTVYINQEAIVLN